MPRASKKRGGTEGADAPRPGARWTLSDAGTRLPELVERAVRQGPQVITRDGRSAAVVVSAEEWERRTAPAGTLAEFLLQSPLRDAELDLDRNREAPRDVGL